ncbi:hypothetical protein CEE45_10645 [Candidatus Heimdallarchaeota archaeon B3_Heim]|nr:MAG: hypothetical protein CEE45_10645 [Candidatus Heimdallarchaeota archaeon B3_Heim]
MKNKSKVQGIKIKNARKFFFLIVICILLINSFNLMSEDYGAFTLSHEKENLLNGLRSNPVDPEPAKLSINPNDEGISSILGNPSFELPLDQDWQLIEGSMSRSSSIIKEGSFSLYVPNAPFAGNNELEQVLKSGVPLSCSPIINTWIYPTGVGQYGTEWAGAFIRVGFKSSSSGEMKYLDYRWAGYFTGRTNTTSYTHYSFPQDWAANSWNNLYRNLTADFTASPLFPDPHDYYLSLIRIRNHYSTASPPPFYVDSFSITSLPAPVDTNCLENGLFDEGNLDGWDSYKAQVSSSHTTGSGYTCFVDRATTSDPHPYNSFISQQPLSNLSLTESIYLNTWIYPEKVGYLAGQWNYAGLNVLFTNGTITKSVHYTWAGSFGIRANTTYTGFIILHDLYPNWKAQEWNLLYRNLRSDFMELFGMEEAFYNYELYHVEFVTHYSNNQPGWFYIDNIGLYRSLIKNPGFEDGLLNWDVETGDQTPQVISTPQNLVLDGNKSLFMEEELASPYYRRLNQEFQLDYYPVVPNTYLWAYIYPTFVGNTGSTWPYDAINIRFSNSNGSDAFAIKYFWAGNLLEGPYNINVSSTWNANQWNLLFRDIFNDFSSGFPEKTPEDYSIVKISIVYHFSNYSPGSFYADNVDLLYPYSHATPPDPEPVFTQTPDDLSYNFAAIDKNLTWIVSDNNPNTYSIFRNSSNIDNGVWASGTPIILDITGLSTGSYNFTITLTDDENNHVSDEVWVYVNSLPPLTSFIQNPSFETPFGDDWVVTEGSVIQSNTLVQDGTYSAYFATTTWPTVPDRTLIQNLTTDVSIVDSPLLSSWIYSTGLGWYGTEWAGAFIRIQLKSFNETAPSVHIVYKWAGYFPGWPGSNTSTYTYYLFDTKWTVNSWNHLYRNLLIDFIANGEFPDPQGYYIDSVTIRNHYSTQSPPAFYVDNFTISLLSPFPTITNSPQDLVYDENTIGHELKWTVVDNDTANFTIYRNDAKIANDSWLSGIPVIISVDGLAIGVYNFTIILLDQQGNLARDEVFVSVQAGEPVLLEFPDNFTYELGSTGNILNWTAVDTNPATYDIYQNNSIIKSNSWLSDVAVLIDVDGLTIGTYNFTIIFRDTLLNVVSSEVWVTVEDITPPVFLHGTDEALINGNFEYGDLTAWTTGTGTDRASIQTNPFYVHSGSYGLALITYNMDTWVYSDAWIEQNVLRQILVDELTNITFWGKFYSNHIIRVTVTYSDLTTSVHDFPDFHSTWYKYTVSDLILGKLIDTVRFERIGGGNTASTTAIDDISLNYGFSSTNITYLSGSSGNIISWIATDHAPDSYVIYQDGTELISGMWEDLNQNVLNIDGLTIGTYWYTIELNDTSSNLAILEFIVTVTSDDKPVIASSPSDFTYELGETGITISWIIYASSPDYYALRRNQVLIATNIWVSGESLIINIDNLDIGTYNYTISFFNEYGQSTSDTVFIDVVDTQAPHVSPVYTVLENGGFEMGDLSGWTTGTGTDRASIQTNPFYVYSGNFGVALITYDQNSQIYSDAWIEQTLNEVILVDEYTSLTFWARLYSQHQIQVTVYYSDSSFSVHLIEDVYHSWHYYLINSMTLGQQITKIRIERIGGGNMVDTTAIDQIQLLVRVSNDEIQLPYGSSVDIGWVVFDYDPETYSIFLNNEIIETGTWTNGIIYANFDSLAVGSYNLGVEFQDGSGNSVYYTISILIQYVSETTIPSTTSFSSDTSSGTTTTQSTTSPIPELMVLLAIFIIGLKRKKTKFM